MTEWVGNARMYESKRREYEEEAQHAEARGNAEHARLMREAADRAAAERDRVQRQEELRRLNRGAHRRFW